MKSKSMAFSTFSYFLFCNYKAPAYTNQSTYCIGRSLTRKPATLTFVGPLSIAWLQSTYETKELTALLLEDLSRDHAPYVWTRSSISLSRVMVDRTVSSVVIEEVVHDTQPPSFARRVPICPLYIPLLVSSITTP